MDSVAGDVGITIRQVAELFMKLKSAYEAKDDYSAEEHLDEIKKKIIFFPTFLNVGVKSPNRAQEIILVREVLEHAVLLNARMKNVSEFERHFNMLQSYYNDTEAGVVPESAIMFLIIGLNLVRLLVVHRIAEFHSELEKIAPANHRNSYILFAIQMERYLMEGSYNKLLHARTKAPSNEYMPIVEMLEGTVREEVGRCLPAAYGSISVEDAGKMMMLKSKEEVATFAKRQKWTTVDQGSSFLFAKDGLDTGKRDIPFQQILKQNIVFAAELQRVV